MKYDIESIEKRKNTMKKVTSTAKKILFIILILLIYNIFLVISSGLNQNEPKEIFGYKAYIIVTDSMKPNINTGDIVVIKKDESELKIGSVITYKNKNELVTHRIVQIKETDNEKAYITKGDNNNVEDAEKVYAEQIEGNVVVTIPYLGNIILILKNRVFDIILVTIIFAIYIYIIRVEDKKITRRKKKKIEDEKFKNDSNQNN